MALFCGHVEFGFAIVLAKLSNSNEVGGRNEIKRYFPSKRVTVAKKLEPHSVTRDANPISSTCTCDRLVYSEPCSIK